MSYTIEQVQLASKTFFELFRKKMIPIDDPLAAECLNEPRTFELMQYIAQEAGCRVVNTGYRFHLVVHPIGSVFATNFTHLKGKYSRVDRKVHLHIINIIILVFLAEMDQDESSFKPGQDSMSYMQISDNVSGLFHSWGDMDGEGAFSEEWQLDVQSMTEVWNNLYMQSKTQEEGDAVTRGSNSRIGLIHEGMKILEDEHLVYVQETERRVYPREELYERIRYLYHDQNRFQELKQLINDTIKDKGGQPVAKN